MLRFVTDSTVILFFCFLLFVWPSDLALLWKEGRNVPLLRWRPHMTENFPWEMVFYTAGNSVLANGLEVDSDRHQIDTSKNYLFFFFNQTYVSCILLYTP